MLLLDAEPTARVAAAPRRLRRGGPPAARRHPRPDRATPATRSSGPRSRRAPRGPARGAAGAAAVSERARASRWCGARGWPRRPAWRTEQDQRLHVQGARRRSPPPSSASASSANCGLHADLADARAVLRAGAARARPPRRAPRARRPELGAAPWTRPTRRGRTRLSFAGAVSREGGVRRRDAGRRSATSGPRARQRRALSAGRQDRGVPAAGEVPRALRHRRGPTPIRAAGHAPQPGAGSSPRGCWTMPGGAEGLRRAGARPAVPHPAGAGAPATSCRGSAAWPRPSADRRCSRAPRRRAGATSALTTLSLPKPGGARADGGGRHPARASPASTWSSSRARGSAPRCSASRSRCTCPRRRSSRTSAVHFKWGRASIARLGDHARRGAAGRGRARRRARLHRQACSGRARPTRRASRASTAAARRPAAAARDRALPDAAASTLAGGARQLSGGLFVTAQTRRRSRLRALELGPGHRALALAAPATEGDDGPIAAHTMLDRALFRAGETVHMKHVLRLGAQRGFAAVARRAPAGDARRSATSAATSKYELPLAWDARRRRREHVGDPRRRQARHLRDRDGLPPRPADKKPRQGEDEEGGGPREISSGALPGPGVPRAADARHAPPADRAADRRERVLRRPGRAVPGRRRRRTACPSMRARAGPAARA